MTVDPGQFLELIRSGMARATYEKLEDGCCYGEIPGFDGVWATGGTIELCRKELREVLQDWIMLGVRLGDEIPEP